MSLKLIPVSLMRRSARALALSVLVLPIFYAVSLATQVVASASLFQQGTIRDRVQQRIEDRQEEKKQETSGEKRDGAIGSNWAKNGPTEMREIAGLKVAIWKPSQSAGSKSPLIVFSHAYHGCNIQSTFLMRVLKEAGYLIVAPNHRDALCGNGLRGVSLPPKSFALASTWNSTTFEDRRDDIKGLIASLHRDPQLNSQIDWTRVALAGHSLGGYTVLGLAGAWPGWKISNIKAVLALSPYCQPFVQTGNLAAIGIPVMYQGGTLDLGITPFVRRPNGCFAKTSSPAVFVDFNGAGHLAWTDLTTTEHNLIEQYSLEFLDKYLRGNSGAKAAVIQSGVFELKVK